jgi:hypothetical protein
VFMCLASVGYFLQMGNNFLLSSKKRQAAVDWRTSKR